MANASCGLSLLALAAAAQLVAAPRSSEPSRPVAVTLDQSEANAALAILASLNAGQSPSPAQLSALYTSRPYIRLHERAKEFGQPFTDEQFIARLTSLEMRGKAPGLARTLASWNEMQITSAAQQAFGYLPLGSKLRATIYPVIKASTNTFVFDVKRDPAIFYTLDPAEPHAKFANTLVHELHHIGLSQNCPTSEVPGAAGVAALREWVGAFGEGLAMLAAAGGPQVHPHAVSTPTERALWDSEMPKVDGYQREQNKFFLGVLNGTAGDRDAIDKAMFAYFGEAQGPWYSVGYRMAVTIEREFGRPAVIDAFCRSHTLLETYNRAAAVHNERGGQTLPLWDQSLAAAISGDK